MSCDVIMLSYGHNQNLRKMTETAVKTCLGSEPPGTFNIIVVEQKPGITYENVINHHISEEFNLGLFFNEGAKLGSAEWICIANNDLIFNKGWFSELMKIGYSLMSTRDPKLNYFNRNITGWSSGVHLSNWCFVIKRVLWEKIGGFDDYKFWCAIDSLIEKLKKEKIPPMFVHASVVTHLGSQTLMTQGDKMYELTVAQAKRAIAKNNKLI